MVDPNHQAIRHKLMQLLAQHFLSYGPECTTKLTKPQSGAVQVKQNKQFPFSRYEIENCLQPASESVGCQCLTQIRPLPNGAYLPLT